MAKALVFPAGMAVLLVAAAGCSSPDRPATSDSLVSAPSGLGVAPAGDPGERGEPARVCEPRANRPCTVSYVDDDGQLQCPVNVQICSVDGSEWLACGRYRYDEARDPQPFE